MTGTIVVTHPIHAAVRERLAAVGDVIENLALEPWSDAQLRQHLQGAVAMMGFMTDRVDAALLAGAPQLRIVAAALKGYDSYDVAACAAAGVWLSIVPDLLTEPTAELAIGLAISLGRHVRDGDALVRAGAFSGWRAQLFGIGLRGATVAVVGLGRVGQAIVDRLQGFECAEILGVDPALQHPQATHCGLHEALARADFVFLAVPLTPESIHLLDATALAQAKRGQLLINVGRGSTVDEAAVLAALQSQTLAGYAADVFAFEDWSLPERPSVLAPALARHPNTVFTPHLGSAVRSVRLAIEHRAADNIIAVLEGREPLDPVNRPCKAAGASM